MLMSVFVALLLSRGTLVGKKLLFYKAFKKKSFCVLILQTNVLLLARQSEECKVVLVQACCGESCVVRFEPEETSRLCVCPSLREVPLSAAEFLTCSPAGGVYHLSSSSSLPRLSPGAGVGRAHLSCARGAAAGNRIQIWGSKSRQYLETICRQSFNWI